MLRFVILVCLGSMLWAQDTQQKQDPTQQQSPTALPPNGPPQTTPDNSAQPPQAPDQTNPPPTQTQPEVVPNEPPAQPEDLGPGVLTRGFTVSPLADQQIKFRPYFTVSGIADDGLVSPTTTNNQLTQQQNYGVDAGFGIAGRRVFKKDTFELEFHGDIYSYTPDSSYDGGNYVLALTYQHQVSRHILLALTENAGLYSTNFSLLNSAVDLSAAGTNLLATPNTQLFDNRTLYLSTGADMVIEMSRRWSIDLGGTGFLVRRESTALYGTTGANARADTTYRFTRRFTVGAFYDYANYQFNHAFGGSNVNTEGMTLSYQLTRNFELRLRGGESKVYTQGIQVITLDPIIAAILGITQGTIAVQHTNYVPDVTVQLFSRFKVGTASLEYLQSVSPGNGLFLTSRRTSASGHYDYTGVRRWTFTLGGGYDDLITLGLLTGEYRSLTARTAVTRTLRSGFQGTASIEFRHYDLTGAAFLRNSYRVTLGVAWAPGERPLKLW
jgi:hypothetical protein